MMVLTPLAAADCYKFAQGFYFPPLPGLPAFLPLLLSGPRHNTTCSPSNLLLTCEHLFALQLALFLSSSFFFLPSGTHPPPPPIKFNIVLRTPHHPPPAALSPATTRVLSRHFLAPHPVLSRHLQFASNTVSRPPTSRPAFPQDRPPFLRRVPLSTRPPPISRGTCLTEPPVPTRCASGSSTTAAAAATPRAAR